MSTTRPDYENMSGQELLDAYNAMTESPRKAKFETKAEAIRKCDSLWKQSNGNVEVKLSESPEKENYPTPKEAYKRKKQAGGTRRMRKHSWKFKVLTPKNPRRETSAAYGYYEAILASKTVGEYLDKYQDPIKRRDANLWISHNIEDGHIELIEE